MSLWGGGRFTEGPADALWTFTVDTSDRRMLGADVAGSIAHVAMLGEVGILSSGEVQVLSDGLDAIASEAASRTFEWRDSDEDVHSAVERRLGELVGEVAGKLHTGRSRNDQVALDLRLALVASLDERVGQIEHLIDVLVAKARGVGDVVVASYTHLQQAQAVPLAHHLLAYAWMLVRDVDRFRDARVRLAVSPLGAGASGGSSLPLDPEFTAARIGLDGVFANSMDAVGSRDTIAEYVWCVTQTMVHLSRLSEELLLWSTSEFGWVSFTDAYTTGSSAMPHKKNADIAELVRGRTASVIGDLTTIATLQKGLPMTYNRDLQEDKRAVFHADDTLAGSLGALAGLLSTATFDPPAPIAWVTALDLAEALVERGVPFREAHFIVGAVVAALVDDGRTFEDLTADELVAFDVRFIADDLARLDPSDSLSRRTTHGGGSLDAVAHQLAQLEQRARR